MPFAERCVPTARVDSLEILQSLERFLEECHQSKKFHGLAGQTARFLAFKRLLSNYDEGFHKIRSFWIDSKLRNIPLQSFTDSLSRT